MKKIFTVLWLLLLTNASFAQVKDSAYSFSVQQSIEYAFKNQSKILNAVMDEQIAVNKVKETIGIGLPRIGGNFDFKDYFAIPTMVAAASSFGGPPGVYSEFKFGLRYNATAGLDASQLIFDGSYLVGLQASKTYRELSQKNVERTRIETAVAVYKAYYSALINEERFKLMNINVERIKKLMDDTRVMYENGFVEKIDLSRITVSYNNLMVEKEKVEQLLKIGYYMLKFQMGMDLNTDLTLTDKLDTEVKAIAFSDKIDFSKRIEYSLMQTQQRLLELDLKRYRMAYLPSIVAYGNLSAQAMRETFDVFDADKKWYPIGIIGAKVTVPIFDGLQNKYKTQQAKLSLLKTRNDIKNLEQGLSMEIRVAQVAYQNSQLALEVQKKNIQLAEEVYNTSKIKYDLGVGSNLEILNADAALKESQTNYYNAIYDALVAKIDMDKANGNIK